MVRDAARPARSSAIFRAAAFHLQNDLRTLIHDVVDGFSDPRGIGAEWAGARGRPVRVWDGGSHESLAASESPGVPAGGRGDRAADAAGDPAGDEHGR